VIGVAMVCLAACRGVVGIHDLELGDAGTDAGGLPPPPPGEGGPPPPPPVKCFDGGAKPDCLRCCHQDPSLMTGNMDLLNAAHDCLCNTACTSQCGSSFCAAQQPDMPCAQCIDQNLNAGGACGGPFKACSEQAACKPETDCIASCGP